MGSLSADRVEISDQLAIVVVQGDRLLQVRLGDRSAAHTFQLLDKPLVLTTQEINAGRRTGIVRKMEKIHVKVGEIPLHHETEVASRIADGTKDDTVEYFEVFPKSHLQRGLNNGTDKGTKAGVGVLNVESIPATAEPDGQHACGMNDLDRRVYREIANYSGTPMLVFPAMYPLKA
jgi:hypothetical protein